MSDETGNGVSVLYCVSGCYAEVHISWENLFHILSMTGINYCDGITINAVCKIPFVCIGHVVAKPACQFRFTSWQSALNLINRIDSVSYIAMHAAY